MVLRVRRRAPAPSLILLTCFETRYVYTTSKGDSILRLLHERVSHAVFGGYSDWNQHHFLDLMHALPHIPS